jgi:hypothetical protein
VRFTGEDRLDNLVLIVVLLIAVAQGLTVLLTIRRERDIKELGKLVEEQRLRVVELTTWLARRNAARPRLKEPVREPESGTTANSASEPVTTPKDLSDSPSTTESELERTRNVINWLIEDTMPREAPDSSQGTPQGTPPEKKIG